MADINKTVYDENGKPKITKEEMEKGMYNMVNKGLIPKYADLTPGFTRNGNPMKTTANVRDLYGKRDVREEIETESVSKIKYNFEQNQNIIIKDYKDNKTFFLTADKQNNLNKHSLKDKLENMVDGKEDGLDIAQNQNQIQNSNSKDKDSVLSINEEYISSLKNLVLKLKTRPRKKSLI
jgi:hypothetical protein